MTTKQISVFLENQPGKLAEFTACLSAQNIDIRALSLAEASDFGIVRIMVDDVLAAANVLRNENYICTITDVLTVEVKDEPGALSKMITALGENQVNLEYMYAITASKKGVAYMVIRVSDNAKAKSVLKANGMRIVTQEELA